MCKSTRVAEPAYYCGEDCARAHWKAEHKAWHEALDVLRAGVVRKEADGNTADFHARVTAPMYQNAVEQGFVKDFSTNPYYWQDSSEITLLRDKASDAMHCGKFREAVALAKRAISLEPANPRSHMLLAMSYARSKSADMAAQTYLRTMELSEETQAVYGWLKCECIWAHAFAGLTLLIDAEWVTIDLPVWVEDDDQFKQMADRAVFACPTADVLRARVYVYEQQDDPSAADLRQALRDLRRIVEIWPDKDEAWRSSRAEYEDQAESTEAKLRARIAADVEAARATIESLQPNGRGRGRGGGRGERFSGRGRSRSV